MKLLVGFAALALVVSTSAGNIIVNGDFESGALDESGLAISAANVGVWHGSPSWEFVADSGPAGAGDTAALTEVDFNALPLMQIVPAPANGTVLDVSFDYQLFAHFADEFEIAGVNEGDGTIFVSAQSSPPFGTNLLDVSLDQNNGWGSYSDQFTVTGDFDYLLVWFSFGGQAAGHGVDNVVLTPEPASLSVLALGALALIRRRR